MASKGNGKHKPTNRQIENFIKRITQERRDWASSPEGVAYLGPGSPVIPGLQEYYRILRYVQTGDEREVDR